MLMLGFLGCFSPQEGEWGFFDISELGDCELESSESAEGMLTISTDSPDFSIVRNDENFSCSLDGQAFTCAADSKTVSSEEVELTAEITASGEFDSKTSGMLEVVSKWSCTEGDCELYGLKSCTRNEQGTIRLAAN